MIIVTDEFTSELHITLRDDIVALRLVDVDHHEVEVTLSREDMRHLLAVGESSLPRLAGTDEEGVQVFLWDDREEPVYRFALWDADMASEGGALTFYPRAADIDALNI